MTIAALTLGFMLPAAASAQDDSAIDQYVESVPGAGGDQAGGGSGGGRELPESSAEALRSAGGDGAAAAALAEATAPGDSGSGPGTGGGSGGSADGAGGSGGPSVGQIVSGVTAAGPDSGGLGIWLPLGLGATLLGALAFVLVRRSRGRDEATQV